MGIVGQTLVCTIIGAFVNIPFVGKRLDAPIGNVCLCNSILSMKNTDISIDLPHFKFAFWGSCNINTEDCRLPICDAVRIDRGVAAPECWGLQALPKCFPLFNPLNPELNPIRCLLELLGTHHFLRVSRIRVKSLTLRRLMSYIYGAPILDVSRSHTTTQHSR